VSQQNRGVQFRYHRVKQHVLSETKSDEITRRCGQLGETYKISLLIVAVALSIRTLQNNKIIVTRNRKQCVHFIDDILQTRLSCGGAIINDLLHTFQIE